MVFEEHSCWHFNENKVALCKFVRWKRGLSQSYCNPLCCNPDWVLQRWALQRLISYTRTYKWSTWRAEPKQWFRKRNPLLVPVLLSHYTAINVPKYLPVGWGLPGCLSELLAALFCLPIKKRCPLPWYGGDALCLTMTKWRTCSAD